MPPSAEAPVTLQLLRYSYVDGMLERRAPHRDGHIAHVGDWTARGKLVISGAVGDPPTGALLAFDAEPAEVEEFAAADPYVAAGLVTEHSIEPWTVVGGRAELG